MRPFFLAFRCKPSSSLCLHIAFPWHMSMERNLSLAFLINWSVLSDWDPTFMTSFKLNNLFPIISTPNMPFWGLGFQYPSKFLGDTIQYTAVYKNELIVFSQKLRCSLFSTYQLTATLAFQYSKHEIFDPL